MGPIVDARGRAPAFKRMKSASVIIYWRQGMSAFQSWHRTRRKLGTGLQSFSEENPIWTLARKHCLINTWSNFTNVTTFDETGPKDFSSLQDEYDAVYAAFKQDAGYLLAMNLQDRSARTGFSLVD
ncbi:hypothetical protein Cob_v012401 [Colletotrichum orbiculare MAFF 240422]|uniref:Uncharacterized protein n=1 Tax=Colletotrichum orbiculare (strain 104-T / ATCC 96160 / CBS 514.97 / LARS 414 / MAFF 240422) TaxID=1213857 RepID=A0A484F9Y4_COLOR|nr:hypothetical protein Cob_v012401 [Colletotrichum orbiculare MAFF 240422]